MGDISVVIFFLWGEFFFTTCFHQMMFFRAKNKISLHLATMAIGSANPGHAVFFFVVVVFFKLDLRPFKNLSL